MIAWHLFSKPLKMVSAPWKMGSAEWQLFFSWAHLLMLKLPHIQMLNAIFNSICFWVYNLTYLCNYFIFILNYLEYCIIMVITTSFVWAEKIMGSWTSVKLFLNSSSFVILESLGRILIAHLNWLHYIHVSLFVVQDIYYHRITNTFNIYPCGFKLPSWLL